MKLKYLFDEPRSRKRRVVSEAVAWLLYRMYRLWARSGLGQIFSLATNGRSHKLLATVCLGPTRARAEGDDAIARIRGHRGRTEGDSEGLNLSASNVFCSEISFNLFAQTLGLFS